MYPDSDYVAHFTHSGYGKLYYCVTQHGYLLIKHGLAISGRTNESALPRQLSLASLFVSTLSTLLEPTSCSEDLLRGSR